MEIPVIPNEYMLEGVITCGVETAKKVAAEIQRLTQLCEGQGRAAKEPMTGDFGEFVCEAIAEIKANPHKYPNVCRMMVGRLERMEAEAGKMQHDLDNANLETEDQVRRADAAESTLSQAREEVEMWKSWVNSITSIISDGQRRLPLDGKALVFNYERLKIDLATTERREKGLRAALEELAEATTQDWYGNISPTSTALKAKAALAAASEVG